jgi:hypothetical protein
MKKTFYFSHDYNARNDPKLQNVLMKLGHEGKSVYWDLIEMMFEQGGYLIIKEIDSYAFALRTHSDCIKSLINDFGLFVKDTVKFWSESVLKRLNIQNEKSKKAVDSAHKRWDAIKQNDANALKNDANASLNGCEGNAIKESKVKESKVKEKEEININMPNENNSQTPDLKIKGYKALNQDEFRKSLAEYEKEFSTALVMDFYAYWSEPDSKNTMRFQKQDTWEVKRRLQRWQRNNQEKVSNSQKLNKQQRNNLVSEKGILEIEESKKTGKPIQSENDLSWLVVEKETAPKQIGAI